MICNKKFKTNLRINLCRKNYSKNHKQIQDLSYNKIQIKILNNIKIKFQLKNKNKSQI